MQIKTIGDNGSALFQSRMLKAKRHAAKMRACMVPGFVPLESISVDGLRAVRIVLSYGGPADYFEININPDDGRPVSGRYVYEDLAEHVERNLRDDEIWAVIDSYLCGDVSQYLE